ncbi:MAG: hypothetical protein ACMUEL_00040 [Flavobacteriales bacterium Tduv]
MATILAKFFVLLFCMLTMILGSVALALWMGCHYRSYALGFGIMTGIYAIFAIISVVFWKTLLDRFLKDFLTWSVFKKSNKGTVDR